jgi:hypothetical protein
MAQNRNSAGEAKVPADPTINVNSSESEVSRGPIQESWSAITYVALVALLTFVVKVIWALDIPTSALFADDYNALNRAIYYSQGVLDLGGTDYPFEKSSAGIVYYTLIAPWVLLPHPLRLQFVFAVNALLGSILVFFAALAIRDLTKDKSFLVPLAMATLATPFVFNFYVMTENAVFALLGIIVFLIADFKRTTESKPRFFILLLVVALLPLTRAPGVAVLCGLLPLLLVYRKTLGLRRMVFAAVAFVSAAFIPYVGYIRIFGSARESRYATSLSSLLQKSETWIDAIQLSLCQLGYVFLSGGAWTLPLVLLVAWQIKDSAGGEKWKGFLTFNIGSAAGFLGLSLIHLIPKVARGGGNGWFTYGRYADPGLLLLVIAGLACAFFPLRDASPSRWLYRLLAPILFVVAMINFADTNWSPVNQIGLALFANSDNLHLELTIAALVVFGLFQINPNNASFRTILLLSLVVFNVLTLREGMIYTEVRAKRGEYALAGANWIVANTAPDARIGFRWDITGERAPGGIKKMWNTYRAMMFRTYPRSFVQVNKETDLDKVDYLYTLRSRPMTSDETLVWSNQHYGVYQIRDMKK